MARPLPEALGHLSPRIAAVVADVRDGLEALYGDRLARVVLYGSQARGDARPDSDIDLLVVLHGEVRPYDEIKRTSDLGFDVMLDWDVEISLQPYASEIYSAQESGFLRNVRQDGIDL